MDTKEVIARFEAERQALALMDHPNIARVFDAGATDTGRPFFVMELVRGIPITTFCDEQNLPTRARLELFTHVCHAVQHAHQKGIIHRDLKPSNILVTLHDGVPVPKVIDFGIAKATQGRLTDSTLFTAFEQFIGTPAYMSPEQAEMSGLDIDTRSDIYSLGVLLYELLTGRTPFDPKTLTAAGVLEIRRIIREVDPPRPSTRLTTLGDLDRATIAKQRATVPAQLMTLMRGDLDWVVMKALEKNRVRRYETPSAFADDIKRHLGNEPALARPPSVTYWLGKTIRRNKFAFAATGAIAVSLVIGLSLATWMFLRERDARERAVAAELQQIELRRQADRDRERANAEADISRAVSSFLTNDLLRQADSGFQVSTGTTPNPDLKVREALDRASEKVEPRFRSQPLTEATVRTAIGSAYQGVGDYAKAALHFEHSVQLRKAALGPEHPTTLESMSDLAGAYQSQSKRSEAAVLGAQTLEIQRRVLGPEHPGTLRTMNNLANMYGSLGKRAEADALRAQAFPIMKRVLGAEHPNTLTSMTNLGVSYLAQARYAEAEAISAEAWELQKRVLGHDHPDTVLSMQNLATAHSSQGRLAEATSLRAQALDISKRVRGTEHRHTLMAMSNLAASYLEQGQPAEAILLLRHASEIQSRVLGPGHHDTIASLGSLAGVYRAQGRSAEAAEAWGELLAVQQRTFGPEHTATLGTMQTLAAIEEDIGDYAKAEARLRTVLSFLEKRSDEVQVASSYRTRLGRILLKQRKFAEAGTVVRAALAFREEKQPNAWTTSVTRYVMGAALAGQERFAEAEPLLISAYDGLLKNLAAISPADKGRINEVSEHLVQLYAGWGKPEQAAFWQEKLHHHNAALKSARAPKP
jgi:eukaryotic-like serine/threonine-protein kinase